MLFFYLKDVFHSKFLISVIQAFLLLTPNGRECSFFNK